jgi:hypothetical protein
MPFKVNRSRYDSIDPNVCTAYALGGAGGDSYYIPTPGENGWGITGYLTECNIKTCEEGYDLVGTIYKGGGGGDAYNAKIYDNISKNVKGENLGKIVNMHNKINSIGLRTHTYEVPNAKTDYCGNLCDELGDGVKGCDCADAVARRRICKRNTSTFPYTGDPIKCCLEADPEKLLEMDCDPKYFKTTDNLDVSEACHLEKERFCKDTSAFNASTMEITAEYVDFCGCNYPQEYYDNIAQNIVDSFPGITLGQLGPNVACYAPTCVKADEAVKPISNYECPANNFQSCIQSIELNNNGIIDGNITVDGTIECQQFYDSSASSIEGGGPGGIINHFYKCEDNKCIRDDENGEYDNDKCDNKCENKDESNNVWIWVLVVILILALVGSGLYLIFSDNSNNKTEIAYIQE